MTRGLKPPADPLAIIDIGSNSARLVIYHREMAGQFRILGSARQSLRLVRDVDRNHRLSAEAMLATLRALADFRSMIIAYGARRTVAVATAAMRDADNGKELIARVRAELDIRIELIDAGREAYYGALGGIRGLPVTDGMLFDLGGGSVQMVRFHRRRPGASISLALGSLRISNKFLRHDPPAKREVRMLRNYIERTLDGARLPRLEAGEVLVGVGGTVRNLAKVDAQLREYPIARVHGYTLTRERLTEIVDLLCRKPMRSGRSLVGLSREREDSIVGGALAIEALVARLGARAIVVSGGGVREGLAYSLIEEQLPSPQNVQHSAVISLASRFSTWDAERAERRSKLVARLLAALAAGAHPEIKMAAAQAAILLDIGRSLDYFDRYEHAATMVMDTELDGFNHRQIVLLSAIIANAGDDDAVPHIYEPLLKDNELLEIRRAAVLLRLADDMLQRWPRRVPVAVRCKLTPGAARFSGGGLEGWTPRGIGSRFERLFNRKLVV